MFYVLRSSDTNRDQNIALDPALAAKVAGEEAIGFEAGADDIDFVDDALLNTAPHNAIERQLLTGDVVGLALMSGAIIWSAMGAIA
ncbi:hypothetical protein [Methylopila turkensis]|uniref:Uncharacterized protein n=1 Tax=Methylopila turkensis TaxID=1437816 RepID=A0A9W6JRK4_9HYPH|nr:hypothetical protein [Methylopila turkensis]GLK81059.1 hypothetical protein GCM10008174_28000 [Methylopila turkensis]